MIIATCRAGGPGHPDTPGILFPGLSGTSNEAAKSDGLLGPPVRQLSPRATKIIAADVRAASLENARRFGATHKTLADINNCDMRAVASAIHKLVTRTCALDELPAALDDMMTGKNAKVAILFAV